MNKRARREKLLVTRNGIEYELEPCCEGGYVVCVPLYRSCVSEGDTVEHALNNAEDALLGCLAAARELNLPIPRELEPLLRRSSEK